MPPEEAQANSDQATQGSEATAPELPGSISSGGGWTPDETLRVLALLLALLLGLLVLVFAQGYPRWTQGATAFAILVCAAQLRSVATRVLLPAAGALAVVLAPALPPAAPNPSLSGTWLKNNVRSDSLDPACEAMRLNGILRTAVRFVRGMELSIDGGTMEIAMFSVVPWFKIRERYKLTGEVAMWGRRDMRRGKHRGVLATQANGGILVTLEWDAPLGGRGTDEFVVVSHDELLVRSILYLDGAIVRYNVVYDRKR